MDDEEKINIEKTDDEEEINARNEVDIAYNDYNSERNNNIRVVIKDKNDGTDILKTRALDIIRELKGVTINKNKSSKPGHFG